MIRRWNEARAAFEQLIALGQEEQMSALEELSKTDRDLAEIVGGLLEQDRQAMEAAQAPPGQGSPPGETRDRKPPEGSGSRRVIGRFHLRHRLATGRLSSVWSAARADGAFEQEVAIKLIDTAASALEAGITPASIRGRERHVLAAIDSPFVVRLIDAGEVDEDTEWVALELLDGEPLNTYADRRRLGIHDRVRLVTQACRAVEACHRVDVLHLDLSPSNLLVTAHGDVRLIDFGSARRAPAEGADAVDGRSSSFTPAYAAPERFRLEPASLTEFDGRTDVWSLGAILHELLTSKSPIEIENLPQAEATRRKLNEDALSPARTVRGMDSDALEQVIAHRDSPSGTALARSLATGGIGAVTLAALRRSMVDRTASARELREDLERWLAGEPVLARRETFTQRFTRFARRRPRVAVSSAAILAASAAGVVLLGLAARKAEAATKQIAQLEAQEEEQLDVARHTARRLLTDVYQIVSRQAGTEDLTRRLITMGIEVSESSDDAELNLWLADALVKRGASTNETASWRPELAHACLADTARALELIAPIRASNPERYAAARVAWEAPLISAVARFNLCDIDGTRAEMRRSRAALASYSPPPNHEFERIRWLYAQERIRFIENIFEAEYGSYRTILKNCEESLAIFDEIRADATHLGVDERSRFYRLRVMEKSLRFLEATTDGAAPGEVMTEAALGFLEEAREDAEVVLSLAEAHPTQELMLGRAAEVAELLAHWWIRLDRRDEALALTRRALKIMRGPGSLRRHSALVKLASLETFAANLDPESLPEIREDQIGSEAAALLYIRHGQIAVGGGETMEAARIVARSQALLDTSASSCPERAENRRARAELQVIEGRVELLASESAVGEARVRHLRRARECFEVGLAILESTGGDDLFERNLAPIRAAAAARLETCRSRLSE